MSLKGLGTKLILTLLLIIGLAVCIWWLRPEWYIRAIFPAFSELPKPVALMDADSEGLIYFPSRSPYGLDVILRDPLLGQRSTGMGTLLIPKEPSAAPYPAMVIVHGSRGLQPGREMEYAQWLADQGVAAFVIDSYRPRGIKGDFAYLLRVLAVSEFDALSDAFQALKILRSHPKIDGSRIGIMGFSHGGTVARFAMDNRIKQAFMGDAPGFKLHVDHYGPCYQNLQSASVTGAPLMTLRGDQDATNDLRSCQQRENELRRLGATVEAKVYPGAGHAWENTAPRIFHKNAPYLSGCEIRYDAQGHSYLNNSPLVDLPLDASRARRIAARIRQAETLEPCLHHGYYMGNDPHTKVQARKALQAFLAEHL